MGRLCRVFPSVASRGVWSLDEGRIPTGNGDQPPLGSCTMEDWSGGDDGAAAQGGSRRRTRAGLRLATAASVHGEDVASQQLSKDNG